MLRKIDTFLNGITMYRLLVYGLGLLAVVSLVFSFIDVLHFPITALVTSLGVLLLVCYVTNRAFGYVWRVPTNTESWLITTLILFFVLPPATTLSRAVLIGVAGIIAIASKFIVVYQGKHLFNPAAFTMVLLGLLGLLHATWWVGGSLLWPFTLLLGLLVVRKIRRYHLFLSFAAVSLLLIAVVAVLDSRRVLEAWQLAITSSPLIFLGTIMLTEPATMPGRYRQRLVFGVLIGVLYALHPKLGPVYVYPEVALLAGNAYAYIISPKYRLQLTLKTATQISDHVYDLVFTPNRRFTFLPGQYMEFTLPHSKVDERGNRRTFSIASSPTENDVHIGIKTYMPSSSFKKALLAMQPGDSLYAGQLAGSFTLPQDTSHKLAFIAGGIGVTPFRSMLQYLVDTGEQWDIVLVYAVADAQELAYHNVFEQAAKQGVKIVYVLTTDYPPKDWQGALGPITPELLKQHIPALTERTFYVSGPLGMVEATKKQLTATGIPSTHIITDYFPGY